jgi:hypothetical protein
MNQIKKKVKSSIKTRRTCINGNLEVLKLLCLEYKPDLEYNDDAAFRYAIENKQFEIENNKIKLFRSFSLIKKV